MFVRDDWQVYNFNVGYNLMFLCGRQVAHTCHMLNRINETLLFVRLLDVAVSTAAAAGQLHGRNDEGVEFVHVDDRHHLLGGGLTTWHLDLEKDKERRSQARQASV